MADEIRRRPTQPAPSVLYNDDPYHGPGGMMLTGEWGSDISDDAHELRRMVLRWRGFLAELRKRESSRVAAKIDALCAHLTTAYQLTDEIQGDIMDLSDERREANEERRGHRPDNEVDYDG